MAESSIARLLASLRERWTAQGIVHNQPATETDVLAFEERYGVVVPADLREYFTTLNGTAVGAYGMQDEHLLGFWHLDEVRNFAELADSAHSPKEALHTFAIADHSIWVYGFGIQLCADPTAATPVVVDIALPYQTVSPSFTDFLTAYLRDDEDVIYPNPKVGPGGSDVAVV